MSDLQAHLRAELRRAKDEGVISRYDLRRSGRATIYTPNGTAKTYTTSTLETLTVLERWRSEQEQDRQRAGRKIIAVQFRGDELVRVVAELDDGEHLDLFTYYSDELHFTAAELIGRTVSEARELWHERDVAYLQEP